MLIHAVCSIAIYCQRCGKIHIFDVPYFFGTKQMVVQCDSCGYERAVLLKRDDNMLELTVECISCGKLNKKIYSMKKLRRTRLEKIYCSQEHFELGYIGRRNSIQELLEFNKAEFEALHSSDGKNFIEKQQILLEAVNRVHDIAEKGAIACSCGCKEISADIRGNAIILECCKCGRYYVLRVENSGDLVRLERGLDIELQAPEILEKK